MKTTRSASVRHLMLTRVLQELGTALNDAITRLKQGIDGIGLHSATIVLEILAGAVRRLARPPDPTLPVELVRLILEQVDRANLLSCSLVNLTWSQLAQQKLFRSVQVFSKQQEVRLTGVLDRKPELLPQVRELEIVTSNRVRGGHPILQRLFALESLRLANRAIVDGAEDTLTGATRA